MTAIKVHLNLCSMSLRRDALLTLVLVVTLTPMVESTVTLLRLVAIPMPLNSMMEILITAATCLLSLVMGLQAVIVVQVAQVELMVATKGTFTQWTLKTKCMLNLMDSLVVIKVTLEDMLVVVTLAQ